jgi:hypothetical protein
MASEVWLFTVPAEHPSASAVVPNATSELSTWQTMFGGSQLIARKPQGAAAVEGILPLTLPDGARIKSVSYLLGVFGPTNATPTFTMSLVRSPASIGANTDGDVIATVTHLVPNGGGYGVNVSDVPRTNVVSNNSYCYAIHVFASSPGVAVDVYSLRVSFIV